MNKISCIVVNYNNAKYLAQCINSLLNQNMKINEIIIADDCSTDNSREIIESFTLNNDNIQVIYNEKNLGVTLNRDNAIKAACGEYFTTIDSDDFFFEDKIKNEYELIKSYPDDIIVSNTIDVDKDGNIVFERDSIDFCEANYKRRVFYLLAGNKNKIPRDMLMKKSTYLELKGLNHTFPVYEDWEFKLRLCLAKNQWRTTGLRGTAYRHTNNSLSSKRKIKLFYYHVKAMITNIKNADFKLQYIYFIFLFFAIKIPKVLKKNMQ